MQATQRAKSTKSKPQVRKLLPILMASIGYILPNLVMAEKPANAHKIDHIVAVVNNKPILKSDLDLAVATAKTGLTASNVDIPKDDSKLTATVLDKMITRLTQMSLIERSGQALNDEAVNATMLKIASTQGIDNLADFQAFLDSKQPSGYAITRQRVSEEMIISQLRDQELRKRVNISEQDVDYFLRSPESKNLFNNEYRTYHIRVNLPVGISSDTRRAEALKLSRQIKQSLTQHDELAKTMNMAKAQTRFTVQGGDMGFHPKESLPAHLKDAILSLQKGGVTEPVVYTDGIHIVKLVDTKAEEAQIETQWKVRHILIKPNELININQAKQQADDLYAKLKQKAGFSTLASTYSDDPGSARKGGSLDWVSSGQMVPEFEEMIKQTNVGQFSKPFQSQFGWHILQVDAEREKDMTDAFKRKLARETLFKRMSTQAIEDWMQELRSNSYIKILDPEFKS